MHPRTAELLAYVDQQAAHLRAAFESVPPERRGARTDPERWSPAEVVHHVAIVTRRLAQRLEGIVEQARAMPLERETSPVVPTSAATRLTDRSTRRVASEASQPRDTDVERVWEDFDDAQHALKRVVVSGDGLALGDVLAPHPALGDLGGYDWVVFAGAHTARHAEQIREMSSP